MPKPVTRRLTALGAAAAVTGGLVPLGGLAPAGAAARPVTRGAAPAGGAGAALPALPANVIEPGCTTDNPVVAATSDMDFGVGTVILWYSPTSRCAWASAVLDGPTEPNWVQVTMVRNDGQQFTGDLGVGLKAVSPVVHDTFPLASAGYAEASYNVMGGEVIFRGKTSFF